MKGIEVQAYSGYKANERPLSFILDGRRLKVTGIIKRWVGEEHDYFKVNADDGRDYLLAWDRQKDGWFLDKTEQRKTKEQR